MSMKVYIAGPWDERERARAIALLLEAKGHSITHDWWNHDGGVECTDEFLRVCAEDDFNAVKCADVFLLLNTQERGKETSGKAVETGVALYANRFSGQPSRLIITGHRMTNLFHLMPEFEHFCNVEDAIDAI